MPLCAFIIALLTVLAPAMPEKPCLRGSGRTVNEMDPGLNSSGCVRGTYSPWGFNLAGQDLSVPPGDDFFAHGNGAWAHVAQKKIPASKPDWGVTQELEAKIELDLRDLLENASAQGQKVGQLYASYMNRTVVENLGIAPLQPDLDRLQRVNDSSSFARLVATGFFESPFALSVDPDDQEPTRYSVKVDQGGLGLPRDYYLSTEHAYVKEAYAKYVTKVLQLLAWPEFEVASTSVLELETRIANISSPDEVYDNSEAVYNPVADVSELRSLAPGFDWATFLQAAWIPQDVKIVLQAKLGIEGIAHVLGTSNMTALKSWAAFHLAANAGNFLPKAFGDATFEFNAVQQGLKKPEPLWQSAVQTVKTYMRESLGQAYAEKHFTPTSKTKVQQLVKELQSSFAARISRSEWLSNATKQKALKKLDAMGHHIGYPETVMNYQALAIQEDDLFGNVQRAMAFQWKKQLSKLQGPVDSNVWDMGAYEVNAYYDETVNAIFFPAGILQPPFYDPEADDAVNFGAIGATIGHEMTHGFDRIGSQYDGQGKLSDWWTQADRDKFSALVEVYGKQFTSFRQGIPVGHHIDARLTADENIADLGGLYIALDAYRAYRTRLAASSAASQFSSETCQPNNYIGHEELEEERRFFLGYAQSWRDVQRPEKLLENLATNVHAPPIARVNVPLQNMDGWYEAFKIPLDSSNFLPQEKRVTIW